MNPFDVFLALRVGMYPETSQMFSFSFSNVRIHGMLITLISRLRRKSVDPAGCVILPSLLIPWLCRGFHYRICVGGKQLNDQFVFMLQWKINDICSAPVSDKSFYLGATRTINCAYALAVTPRWVMKSVRLKMRDQYLLKSIFISSGYQFSHCNLSTLWTWEFANLDFRVCRRYILIYRAHKWRTKQPRGWLRNRILPNTSSSSRNTRRNQQEEVIQLHLHPVHNSRWELTFQCT